MTWSDIESNWPSFMRCARYHWAELTEDDLCRVGGDQLQLIGRLQQRYCIARAEAERQVQEWAYANHPERVLAFFFTRAGNQPVRVMLL